MGDAERKAVEEVLHSGNLAQGAKVAEFEEAFAAYVGTPHGVATNSGTAAIHTALLALGLGPGDEVLLPAVTFFSCAAMVAACGATPVVVDVSEDYTLDPERAEAAVTEATKALMPVHMYGWPAEMGALLDLAEDRDLRVVEDACEAHGARYQDAQVGSLGTVGCFSFYPTKMITTGEGGMLLTAEEDIATQARLIRTHGASQKYRHDRLGYNYRMTDVAAAIGVEQLKRIDGFLAARARNASRLSRALDGIDGLTGPPSDPNRTHVFYQYVIRVEEANPLHRDEVIAKLEGSGVEARPTYPVPIHQQGAFHGIGRAWKCPRAEALLAQSLEVPVHPALSSTDLDQVVAALEAVP